MTDTQAPELLPCPFCGGRAAVVETNLGDVDYVECRGCGAETDGIVNWNTRTDIHEAALAALADLHKVADEYCNQAVNDRQALAQRDAVIARLVEVLTERDGGIHDVGCKFLRLYGPKLCTCGHVEALAALAEAKTIPG